MLDKFGMKDCKPRTKIGHPHWRIDEVPQGRQPTVALSTCEAEYIGMVAPAQESLYLTRLLNNMGRGSYKANRIYGDNRGAIDLRKNPVSDKGLSTLTSGITSCVRYL